MWSYGPWVKREPSGYTGICVSDGITGHGETVETEAMRAWRDTHLDVTAADVEPDGHVVRLVAQAVAVYVEVELIQPLRVLTRLLHAFSISSVAEAGHERIVDL